MRREEGRRRLRVVVATLVVAGAAAIAAGLTRSPALDLDYVDVRGVEHTSRVELLRATGLSGHPLMVEIDTGRVVRRAEALPWVLTARAHRRWPGTVRVEITERVPVAVIPVKGGERWALVDPTGRVLDLSPEKPAGFPAIGNLGPVGPPGTSVAHQAAAALKVSARLPSALRARVADVATGAGGEVELQLTPPGGVVRLGPPEALNLKFAALATLLERADLARVEYIDVRVPKAPVLTRR